MELLIVVAGAAALFGIAWWLERVTGRKGLKRDIGAVVFLLGAAYFFSREQWIGAFAFAVQAVIFFLDAHFPGSTGDTADEHDIPVDKRLVTLFKVGAGFEFVGIMAIVVGLAADLGLGAVVLMGGIPIAIGAALQIRVFRSVRRSQASMES